MFCLLHGHICYQSCYRHKKIYQNFQSLTYLPQLNGTTTQMQRQLCEKISEIFCSYRFTHLLLLYISVSKIFSLLHLLSKKEKESVVSFNCLSIFIGFMHLLPLLLSCCTSRVLNSKCRSWIMLQTLPKLECEPKESIKQKSSRSGVF